MKKLTILLLSIALVLSFAACVNNSSEPDETNAPASDTDLAPVIAPDALGVETVELGTFITTDSDDHDIITFGEYAGVPISWQVLDTVDDKLLVITKDCVTALPYNDEYVAVTWETSSLRKWLNDDFYVNSFSDEDRERAIQTTVITLGNEKYGTPGGNDTFDFVFLLSQEEVDHYLPFKADRYTQYRDDARACWWTRSPGGNSLRAGFIGGIGANGVGYYVDYADNGVRPAMWITAE
jgi:hypothetical protein